MHGTQGAYRMSSFCSQRVDQEKKLTRWFLRCLCLHCARPSQFNWGSASMGLDPIIEEGNEDDGFLGPVLPKAKRRKVTTSCLCLSPFDSVMYTVWQCRGCNHVAMLSLCLTFGPRKRKNWKRHLKLTLVLILFPKKLLSDHSGPYHDALLLVTSGDCIISCVRVALNLLRGNRH